MFTVLHFTYERETLRRAGGRAGQASGASRSRARQRIGADARPARKAADRQVAPGRGVHPVAATPRRCSTPPRARAPPRSCATSASRSPLRDRRRDGRRRRTDRLVGGGADDRRERRAPEQPIVLVIDELPFLIESEPAIEAIIQKQWDRRLEALPVLLVLIGSDVSMMAALNDYGRPLYGRVTEMTIGPLSPAAIGDMLELPPAAALDAYLAIGGFPRLAEIWRRGEDLWKFLRRELRNPESPLIVLGERSLAAEFPAELKARAALEAIGAGERVFTAILQRAQISNKTLETHARDADRKARDRQDAALLRPAAPQALPLLRLRSLPALLAALHPRKHPGARARPRRHRPPAHPRVAGPRSPATRSSRSYATRSTPCFPTRASATPNSSAPSGTATPASRSTSSAAAARPRASRSTSSARSSGASGATSTAAISAG